MGTYIHTIFYMDTYRNVWYNTDTVEKVNFYSRHPHNLGKGGNTDGSCRKEG